MTRMHLTGSNVLWTKAYANDPRRDPTQRGKLPNQAQEERKLERIRSSEHAPDDSILHSNLKLLRGTRRKLSSPLHRFQIKIANRSSR